MIPEINAGEAKLLRERLESDTFQRAGICDNAALQADILSIASSYIVMLHEQHAEKKTWKQAKAPKEAMLKGEHRRRITAHLAEQNQRALHILLLHETALDIYTRALLERAVSAGLPSAENTYVPGTPEGRHAAAMALVGSIIGNALDVLDPDRRQRKSGKSTQYFVPDVYDPARAYLRMEDYQREIIAYLKGEPAPVPEAPAMLKR